MRKLIFPLMGAVWALCLMAAPPLIAESQAQAVQQSYQDVTPQFGEAPASVDLAFKAQAAAPVVTNPGIARLSAAPRPSHPTTITHVQRLVWRKPAGTAAPRRWRPVT